MVGIIILTLFLPFVNTTMDILDFIQIGLSIVGIALSVAIIVKLKKMR